MNVHSSFLRNSSKLCTTQMFHTRWMDKQIVVYTHKMKQNITVIKNEPLLHTMCIILKNIMTNKRTHTREYIICLYLYEVLETL